MLYLWHRNRPGVFSRVSVFEPWIKKVTEGIVSFFPGRMNGVEKHGIHFSNSEKSLHQARKERQDMSEVSKESRQSPGNQRQKLLH